MKEYGVKESWTVLMDFPRYSAGYSIQNFEHLMLWQFPKMSTVLLILDGNSAALFKSNGTKYKAVSFSGYQEGLIITAYMESLVSPNNYALCTRD